MSEEKKKEHGKQPKQNISEEDKKLMKKIMKEW